MAYVQKSSSMTTAGHEALYSLVLHVFGSGQQREKQAARQENEEEAARTRSGRLAQLVHGSKAFCA
eukprot:586297-Pelagomonas_calceolata.AAC.6